MNKNIIIILLSVIIVVLTFKILNPTVVTERKSAQNNQTQIEKEVITEVTQETNTIRKEEVTTTEIERQVEVKKNDHLYSKPQHITEVSSSHSQDIDKIKLEPISSRYPLYKKELQNPVNDKNFHKPNLTNELKICKPYSESLNAEFMGMNMNYQININGWQNDKCIVLFVAKVIGVGDSFQKEYNVEPSDAIINVFAPEIRCEFTKDELLYVGDSILQENERDNRMLKNPNDVTIPTQNNMSESDKRLLEVVMSHRACQITNNGDLNKMIESLFSVQ